MKKRKVDNVNLTPGVLVVMHSIDRGRATLWTEPTQKRWALGSSPHIAGELYAGHVGFVAAIIPSARSSNNEDEIFVVSSDPRGGRGGAMGWTFKDCLELCSNLMCDEQVR